MLLTGDDWKCISKIRSKYSNEDKAFEYLEFRTLCVDLFEIPEALIEEYDTRIRNIFAAFDVNGDGLLDEEEWQWCYDNWMRVVVDPVNVLLIVDVQNDFIDGTLAIKGHENGLSGKDIVQRVNRLIENGQWDKIIYSLDWHPENHISFFENLHMRSLHSDSKITKENAKLLDTVVFLEPRLEQTLWPRHCVEGSWGAELHKDLILPPNAVQIHKGQDPDQEAYSAFAGCQVDSSMSLSDVLRQFNATDIYACGLAYDICVQHTCLDALRLGYRVLAVEDCCAVVNSNDTRRAKDLIIANGGLPVSTDDVLSFVNEKKRSFDLAEQAALRCHR